MDQSESYQALIQEGGSQLDEPCVFKMEYDASTSDNALVLFSDPILLQKVMQTSKYNMELKPALNLLSSPD